MSEPTDRREAAGAPRLPIAAEYERLLALEQERRRRRDSLEALLPTIADALDVRVVFPRLSDVIQEVIPHVTVALALLTPDGLGVKIHVASNYDVGDLPVYRFTNDSETIRANWRAFVGYDCTVLEEGVCRVQTSRPGAGTTGLRRASARPAVDADVDRAGRAIDAARPGSHQGSGGRRDLVRLRSAVCLR